MRTIYQNSAKTVKQYSGLTLIKQNQIVESMKVTKEPAEQTIAKRLRHAKKARHLTQAQLSEQSGVPQTTISSLEAGHTTVSGQIISLALALGVTPEWLEQGINERPNQPTPEEEAIIQLLRALPPDKEATVIDQLLYNVERADKKILAQPTTAAYFDMLTKFKQDIEKKKK